MIETLVRLEPQNGEQRFLISGSSTSGCEVPTIQFTLLKQFFCKHRYRKEPSYRQLRKDDNKTLWICYRCNKHLERDRWNPPEGAVKSSND